MWANLLRYFQHDLWLPREENLPWVQAVWIRVLRLGALVVRGLRQGTIQQRSSILTFYSLLSVVPVVALLFGISKGFGLDQALERQLLEKVQGQEKALQWIIEFAQNLLQQTRGGLVAGIGVVVLFWSMIKVLSNIESAFNDIWGIEKGRPFSRKITDYLALTLICPFLLVMSSAATVLIVSRVTAVVERTNLLDAVSPAIRFGLQLLPYGVLWILFTFLYLFMPNTKVRFRSALVAGLIAGTAYQGFQKLHIYFQIGVAKYNAIYGSFAALPLFLIWLQLSWLIVLIGAQISFAHQNLDQSESASEWSTLSYSARRLLCLGTAWLLVKNFGAGGVPLTPSRVAEELGLSRKLSVRLLKELLRAGIAARVVTGFECDEDAAFQPAIDPAMLCIHHVVQALESCGEDDGLPDRVAGLERLSDSLKAFGEVMEASPANVLLRDL